MEYYFEENRFICSAEKERNAFRYDTIIRLVKEKGYYYMFPNTNQAYMLDRNTLNPQEEEKFEKFIVKKTDLAWTHGMTFLTMNYKTWKYNQQNTKMKRSI